uniref:WD repeat domain 53 n=1 Tax=Neogobius melanostomus TaxID=47308 RepID=A0A8C6T098_9GOBI
MNEGDVKGLEIPLCCHDNRFGVPPVVAPAAPPETPPRHPDSRPALCSQEGCGRYSTVCWCRPLHPQTPPGTPHSLVLAQPPQSAKFAHGCHCGSKRHEGSSGRDVQNIFAVNKVSISRNHQAAGLQLNTMTWAKCKGGPFCNTMIIDKVSDWTPGVAIVQAGDETQSRYILPSYQLLGLGRVSQDGYEEQEDCPGELIMHWTRIHRPVARMNVARQWGEGHSTPILCVGAAPGPEGLLASGSESGQLTVWSQEGIIVGRHQLPDEEDCTSIVFSAASAQLYVSHGENVSVLDPRNLKSTVQEFVGVGEEEINALGLNETGSVLAVADDSGAVRILDLPDGKVCRTLRRHTNICSSVAFRPQRPNNLLSAGLDMQVILWGLQKTRPLWTLSLQDIVEEEDSHQQQPGKLFNPPLAHCVTVSSCGNVVGCAAEDGRVHLMRIGSGSKLEQQGAVKAHSQGVSQAHFINFFPHPYWLISGGNDGHIVLCDLSKHPVVAPEGTSKPQSSAIGDRRKKSKIKPKHKKQDKTESSQEVEAGKKASDDDQAAEAGSSETCAPKLRINHGEKVNWLCPAQLKGEPSVVVADQSSHLAIYSLTTQ